MLPAAMPLRAELHKFTEWCLEPIRADRPGPRVQKSTFLSYISTLSKFLGFVRHFHKLHEKDISILLLTNQTLLLEYLDFQMRVLTSGQALTNHVAHLSRMLTFLSCTRHNEEEAYLVEPMQEHVSQLLELLQRVRDQGKKTLLGEAGDTDNSDRSWRFEHLELPSQATLAEWQWRDVATVRVYVSC